VPAACSATSSSALPMPCGLTAATSIALASPRLRQSSA
jgi:hypothetical protein